MSLKSILLKIQHEKSTITTFEEKSVSLAFADLVREVPPSCPPRTLQILNLMRFFEKSCQNRMLLSPYRESLIRPRLTMTMTSRTPLISLVTLGCASRISELRRVKCNMARK